MAAPPLLPSEAPLASRLHCSAIGRFLLRQLQQLTLAGTSPVQVDEPLPRFRAVRLSGWTRQPRRVITAMM